MSERARLARVEHLVQTLFNVRRAGAARGDHLGLDAGWLDHRIDLFRRYCAPSVANQTSQQFRWLIYVDPYTSTEATHAIKALVTKIDNELVPIDSAQDVDQEVARRVGDAQVITTKLDNDDALDRNHIHRVRSAIDAGARSVKFTSGVVVFTDSGRAYRLLQRHSPFYSLVADPGGVTAGSLSQADLHMLPQPIKELPMGFLRVIHDRNIWGTSGAIGGRVSHDAVYRRFALEPIAAQPESVGALAADYAQSYARETLWRARRRASHLKRSMRPKA